MCVNVQPRCLRSPARVLLAGRVTSLFTESHFSNNKLKITVLKLALSSFKMWFPNGCAQAFWEQVLQPRLLLLHAQLQQLVQAQSCQHRARFAERPGSTSRGTQAPAVARGAGRGRRDAVDASVLFFIGLISDSCDIPYNLGRSVLSFLLNLILCMNKTSYRDDGVDSSEEGHA